MAKQGPIEGKGRYIPPLPKKLFGRTTCLASRRMLLSTWNCTFSLDYQVAAGGSLCLGTFDPPHPTSMLGDGAKAGVFGAE